MFWFLVSVLLFVGLLASLLIFVRPFRNWLRNKFVSLFRKTK